MKILVIDDSKTFRTYATKELAAGHYDVQTAECGETGLQALKKEKFDLVLLDVHMPNLDGYKVCSKIRSPEFQEQHDISPKLPVILVTGEESLESRMMGFQAGATEYLTKNVQPGELLNTVNSLVRPEESLRGLCALVVDDSGVSRKKIAYFFKKQGVKVFEAENGQVAFNIMVEHRDQIHMVITDLEMPVMDGKEFCRKIRREMGLRKLPVIFVTAHSDRNILMSLFEAGATDYLVKPLIEKELLARLKVNIEIMQSLQIEEANRKKAQKDLQESKRIIKDSAKLAGKAELANSVLHNVGNIMNSVNVSCNTLAKLNKQSQIPQLRKVVDLIKVNEPNFAEFIANDSKGQILPKYIMRLGQILSQEHEKVTEEIEELNKKLILMREIISTQQSYAKMESSVEKLDLRGIVDEAIYLQRQLFKGVEIRTDFQSTRTVWGKRSDVTHIFINLLKNAKEAMEHIDDPKVFITTFDESEKIEALSIQDQGVGISPQNLKKMFRHGFTTKEDGHGFGLHYCAKAMREFGGNIRVDSEGEGKGATFTLSFLATSEPPPQSETDYYESESP